VGKYLVSPLVRRIDAGTYSAAVSIRSGRGMGTHDRIFRFIGQFPSHESAERYAIAQGIGWAQQPCALG
jgi:hypothetical protein